jgi:hypothetical protein
MLSCNFKHTHARARAHKHTHTHHYTTPHTRSSVAIILYMYFDAAIKEQLPTDAHSWLLYVFWQIRWASSAYWLYITIMKFQIQISCIISGSVWSIPKIIRTALIRLHTYVKTISILLALHSTTLDSDKFTEFRCQFDLVLESPVCSSGLLYSNKTSHSGHLNCPKQQ